MSSLTPRPGILDIAPYVPGDSELETGGAVIKLSSNEGALGPSPRAIEAYYGTAPTLHRYPDGSATKLRRAIGAYHGLDPKRIVVGCGSDELLYSFARGFVGEGDEIIYSAHGFILYPIIALSVGAKPVTAPETDCRADVDKILSVVTDRTKLVFLANPNNPTGSYLPADELARLRKGLRDDILLVIDCAYAEYVLQNDYSPGIDLVDAGDNTVMTRTFSKIYALGGVRLGWAYCPANVADVVDRSRAPFNVTAGAQAAGIAALEDVDFMMRSRDHNATWLPWISDRLTGLGLKVYPSIANFILVEFPKDSPRTAKEAEKFMHGKGIIPRNTASAGLPDCLRITIGREDEMRAVAAAAAEFMA